MINEAMFREYDIRGLAESELTDPVVERIAMAAAAVYVREGKKEIAMGMDGRPSSPRIKELFSRTLARYGLQVTDLGLVPTPVVYFACFQHKMGGRRHHHRLAQPERIQRLQDPARHRGPLRRPDQGDLPPGRRRALPGRKERRDHRKKTSCPNTWPISKTTSP